MQWWKQPLSMSPLLLLFFFLTLVLSAATQINLATQVKGLLAVANGGTGTASPGLVEGANITITGSWPDQTINVTGGGAVGGAPFNSSLAPGTVTPPVLSGFTGGNLTATGTTGSANVGGAIWLNATNGTGGDNVAWYYKAVPGGTWTATVGFVPMCVMNRWCIGGLIIRDSVSGNLEAMWIGGNTSSAVEYTVAEYNSYTSFAGATLNNNQPWLPPVVWEQLQYNGTDYIWSISPDGQSWITCLTETPTRFLANAANQIGFGMDPITGGASGVLFVHWAGI